MHPAFVAIGHRGNGRGIDADGNREHTVASMQAAERNGATWVEGDPHHTADDHLAFSNSARVDGTGPLIADLTAEEARAHGLCLVEEMHRWLRPGTGVLFDVKNNLDNPEEMVRTSAILRDWCADQRGARPVHVMAEVPVETAPGVPFVQLLRMHLRMSDAMRTATASGATLAALHTQVLRTDPRLTSLVTKAALSGATDVLACEVEPKDVPALVAAGVRYFAADDVKGVVAALDRQRPPIRHRTPLTRAAAPAQSSAERDRPRPWTAGAGGTASAPRVGPTPRLVRSRPGVAAARGLG